MASLDIINICGNNGLSSKTSLDVLSDRGLAYGHGVFETMLCVSGDIPLKDRHLRRLKRGAKRLGIPFFYDDVQSAINTVDAESACIIKAILTAGNGGFGYRNPLDIKPRLIISQYPLPVDLQQQRELGIKLWECQQRLSSNAALAGIKHLNRLEQVLARNEEHADECSDGIMLDQLGNVIETTSANLFIKLPDAGWITPDLEHCGVDGVMRSLLLDEVFPAAGIACTIDRIERAQLQQVREMFSCNSVRGIVPITGIISQNSTMQTLTIGNNTHALQNALHHYFPSAS